VRKRGVVYSCGVNDFQGPVILNGKAITEYYLWKSMLARCYSPIFHKRNPTYKGCEVEPFLLSFTNFHNFVRNLKGFGEVDEKGRPFQMDKDLLVKGNKTYGVDTICFVPREINMFVSKCKAIRGELPIGVRFDSRRGVYRASISLDNSEKFLGHFSNPEEAFSAYKFAKEQQAKVLAEKWKGKVDEKVYHALLNYEVSIED